METENISYLVAFMGGVFTFLSPCLLPLIPSFIAYITGVSVKDLEDSTKKAQTRSKVMAHSLLFIAGFSLVFILLGLTATVIGKALFQYQKAIRITGGILIMLFGLYLTGLLKLDFLLKERRLKLPVKNATYLGSFLIGITFAAAWTPCAGPILGSILVMAGTKANVAQGAKLLTIFSMGIAIPFFITSLLINYFVEYFNKAKKLIAIIDVVGGIFLIIVGILVATNYLSVISERLFGIFTR